MLSQFYLRDPLLASGSHLGDSRDDLSCSSLRHHLGGQNGDGAVRTWGGGAHSQPHSMKNKQLQRFVVHFLHLLHPGVQILGWS